MVPLLGDVLPPPVKPSPFQQEGRGFYSQKHPFFRHGGPGVLNSWFGQILWKLNPKNPLSFGWLIGDLPSLFLGGKKEGVPGVFFWAPWVNWAPPAGVFELFSEGWGYSGRGLLP